MQPFSKLTIFLVLAGCGALSFIKDPIEYLGACFVYAVLLGVGKLFIAEIYSDESSGD